MKWIKERANAFLDCIYPYGAKDRLAHARYEQQAAVVSIASVESVQIPKLAV